MPHSSQPFWKQVDLTYFRRVPLARAWKRRFAVSLPIFTAGLVVAAYALNHQTPYSSGPLAGAHHTFAHRCHTCHTVSWSGLRPSFVKNESMNLACLGCHRASIGHDPAGGAARHQAALVQDKNMTAGMPPCHSCHKEHQGADSLADVADRHCIACHRDLRQFSLTLTYAERITGFSKNQHPQFRIIQQKELDPATIRLNHEVHLNPKGILGPGKRNFVLDCDDCHRAGRSIADWSFDEPRPHEDTFVDPFENEPVLQAAYMNPIRYSLHCAACHPLIAGEAELIGNGGRIPHEPPATIRTYLYGQLLAYIRSHPQELTRAERPAGSRRSPVLDEPPSAGEQNRLMLEWVDTRLKQVEERIYVAQKTCLKCHEQLTPGDQPDPPTIVPPNIPQRWFHHASFTHEKHRVLDCADCHGAAAASKDTKDVLLPGIETCQSCHDSASAFSDERTSRAVFGPGAPSNCATCHSFHVPPPTADRTEALMIQDTNAQAPGS